MGGAPCADLEGPGSPEVRQAPVTARLTTKSTQVGGQSQVCHLLKQERNTLRNLGHLRKRLQGAACECGLVLGNFGS